MDINISNEILKLIQNSQTTVMKLYQFVNGEDTLPSKEEFRKFRHELISSIKRKKENALELFPIIRYFENKRMRELDYEYDQVLFTVPEDEKIAIASPIEVLDEVPDEKEYDLSILWDISSIDERESQNFKAAENYYHVIKEDESLKKFIRYIGTHTEENWQLLEKERELFLENVPQEVHALYQSGDLNSLLPIEIMQLDDPDLEMVFLKNFIETKLLTYQLWGIEREMYEEWIINLRDSGEKGPMFICLDTSGSMRGLTEIIAKGLTMMIVNVLEQHNKNIVFIPFSTEARMYDLFDVPNKLKLTKIQLKKSYYGGTDINPLIDLINGTIHKRKYEKCNILIISDFIFKNFSNSTFEKIKDIKKRGHKFHGLNVSESKFENLLSEVFNSMWSYTFNWKGIFDGNEEELINQIAVANSMSTDVIDAIETFGIIKRIRDTDFVPKTEEQLAEELEKAKSEHEEHHDLLDDDETILE